MRARWIDHAGELHVPADDGVLGLDTEFMRRQTFYPKLALVQAAHAGEHWLLDPLGYDAAADLQALTVGRTCVMHSAGEDLEALAPLLDGQPLRLFDTQVAAAMCGLGLGLSYQNLLAQLLHIDIPKDETRSDWLQRPLSSSQLEYAEQDVAHLEALHAVLLDSLRKLGREAWHAEDCERLARRAHATADAQPHRGFWAAATWPPESQARLNRLLRWRDATARSLDKPRPWIIDDPHAMDLAQQPPRTPQELFERVKGQRALRGPQRAELFELLQATPTAEELAALAPIPSAPRGATRRSADAMRQLVRDTAKRLDLPPGLLCPRRLIEEFAATREWPEPLHGWRTELLQEPMTALLAD